MSGTFFGTSHVTGDLLDEFPNRTRPTVDQVLAIDDLNADVLWGLADHEGSIRAIIDNSATVTETREYSSFGEVLSTGNDFDAFPQAYTGRPWDADVDAYDNRARWYDPSAGRFLSEDPSGFDGGDANLYRYSGNNTPNNNDPTGLDYRGSHTTSSPYYTPVNSNTFYDTGIDTSLWGSSTNNSNITNISSFDTDTVINSITSYDTPFNEPYYMAMANTSLVPDGANQYNNSQPTDYGAMSWASGDVFYNPNEYSNDRGGNPVFDSNGQQEGLGSQLAGRYYSRAYDGLTGIALQINRLLGNDTNYHQFEDDGHVEAASRSARDEFFVNKAEEQGVTPGVWQKITTKGWQSIYPYATRKFEVDNNDKNLPFFKQASFWLGTMHGYEVNGSYEIRFGTVPNDPKQPLIEVRNVSMKNRWVDRIDARSLKQYNWSEDSWGQGLLEGALGDFVGDKLLNASFNAHVNFNDTTPRELTKLKNGAITIYVDSHKFDK